MCPSVISCRSRILCLFELSTIFHARLSRAGLYSQPTYLGSKAGCSKMHSAELRGHQQVCPSVVHARKDRQAEALLTLSQSSR